MIRDAHLLSAFDAAKYIAEGQLTSEALVHHCIDRIQARNPAVQALVAFDAEQALREAKRIDVQPRRPHLHGLPFAAKDILETADLPTANGSPIYAGYRPLIDAACITQFRSQGCALIGKAATSEFATRKPAATCNPLRLTHTPGGSSSGSAAAVADFMVPFALGTQTTGSIARPASYCGVVGFKPTFDFFNRMGLKNSSQSQDTIGLLTRTIRDAFFLAFNDPGFDAAVDSAGTPGFAVCMSSQWKGVDPSFGTMLDRLRATATKAGNPLHDVTLNSKLENLIAIQEQIFVYEAAQALSHERQHHFEQLSDVLRKRLAPAQDINADMYLQSRSAVEKSKSEIDALFGDHDVLIYPATESSAEAGIAYSGSPRLGALWTLLHLPTVVVPFGRSSDDMPFGLQLIGRFGQDRQLLTAAAILQRSFSDDAVSALHYYQRG